MHRSWLWKTRGGSLYFCLACFRYVPTISEPDTGKRFSENKHTLHWHKAKLWKSVEKNFYLFFMQSLIDMTQMFNMIYRCPSFGGPRTENQLRDVGYFQPSPWVVSLAPLSARSLGKGGRASLSRWRHISRLQLRLSYFLWIRVYCSCCCRRCYCWWCLLSHWGRAKSELQH